MSSLRTLYETGTKSDCLKMYKYEKTWGLQKDNFIYIQTKNKSSSENCTFSWGVMVSKLN